MALKDDLIKQLNDIGKQLGRTINTDGSVEDLKLRLREVQEELEALDDSDKGGEEESNQSTATEGSGPEPSEDSAPEHPAAGGDDFVRVRVLRTLHIKGLDPKTRRPVRVVIQDSQVLVASADLQALSGLVSEV